MITALLISIVLSFTSCAAPKFMPKPELLFPVYTNKGTIGVENMDAMAKVENEALTCHYEGFDVTYKFLKDFTITFEIKNNTNRSLIIDKSKAYVLYNGYSTQLFKDVRSTRNTTFNNVQDAINNVQTNEGGVMIFLLTQNGK